MSGITRNYVELPTAINQGIMSIKINGSVELSFSLQTTELHKCVFASRNCDMTAQRAISS